VSERRNKGERREGEGGKLLFFGLFVCMCQKSVCFVFVLQLSYCVYGYEIR
jgi:hypothetical protein